MTREEAIKKLRQMTLPEETREILVALAPELAESEDERIINTIISFLRVTSFYSWNGCKKSEMIAWLEKQKEQHPSSQFRSGDWVVYDGPLGHAILQVKDVVDGRYTFVDNDSTLLEEDSDKFLRPLTPKDVEKKAECIPDSVKFEEGFKTGRESGLRDGQKYVLNNLDSYGLCKLAEWSEEDEEIFNNIIEKAKSGHWIEVNEITWLITRFKSLRPSWKPSEEQMSMLLAVINDPNNAGAESCYMALKSIYNNLKKL